MYGEERGWWDDDFYVASWRWETVDLDEHNQPIKDWEIVLPHQCDEWVIGSVGHARRLIQDLERMIEDGPPDEG